MHLQLISETVEIVGVTICSTHGQNNSLKNNANGFSASVALLAGLQFSSSLQLGDTENQPFNILVRNVHKSVVFQGSRTILIKFTFRDICEVVHICTVQGFCW